MTTWTLTIDVLRAVLLVGWVLVVGAMITIDDRLPDEPNPHPGATFAFVVGGVLVWLVFLNWPAESLCKAAS